MRLFLAAAFFVAAVVASASMVKAEASAVSAAPTESYGSAGSTSYGTHEVHAAVGWAPVRGIVRRGIDRRQARRAARQHRRAAAGSYGSVSYVPAASHGSAGSTSYAAPACPNCAQ